MNAFFTWPQMDAWSPMMGSWLVLSVAMGLILTVGFLLMQRPLRRCCSASVRHAMLWLALLVTVLGPVAALLPGKPIAQARPEAEKKDRRAGKDESDRPIMAP